MLDHGWFIKSYRDHTLYYFKTNGHIEKETKFKVINIQDMIINMMYTGTEFTNQFTINDNIYWQIFKS